MGTDDRHTQRKGRGLHPSGQNYSDCARVTAKSNQKPDI